MYFILEILGTIAFAISGAMVGIKAKMDILGVVVLGITTAIGGGIIRDILIGQTPPRAFQHPIYAIIATLVSFVVFIPSIRKRINVDTFILNLVDAIGLGVFSVVGVSYGLPYNSLILQIFLGVVTGVGGGVMRDLFAMEKPMIFVRHFYAVTSIIGVIIARMIMEYNISMGMIVGVVVIVILRVLAAYKRWNLPKA